MPLARLRIVLLLCTAVCLLLFSLTQTASAQENTDRCHCFRNRSFDPTDRFAADDYLLTTTTNALLASQFNISKRLIVMMKMKGGVANTDLLIGLYLAAAGDTDVGHILVLKGDKTWSAAVQNSPELSRISASDSLAREIGEGLSADQAGRQILSGLLVQRFSAKPNTIQKLEKESLSAKEIVLVMTLADYTKTQPDLIASFHKNGLSWSEIAHNFGLTPAGVGKLLLPSDD